MAELRPDAHDRQSDPRAPGPVVEGVQQALDVADPVGLRPVAGAVEEGVRPEALHVRGGTDAVVDHRKAQREQDAEQQPGQCARQQGEREAGYRAGEPRLLLQGLEVVGGVAADVGDAALQRPDLVEDHVALGCGRPGLLELDNGGVNLVLQVVDLPLALGDQAVADVDAERLGRGLRRGPRRLGGGGLRLHVEDRARGTGLGLDDDVGRDLRLGAEHLLVGGLVEVVDVAQRQDRVLFGGPGLRLRGECRCRCPKRRRLRQRVHERANHTQQRDGENDPPAPQHRSGVLPYEEHLVVPQGSILMADSRPATPT